MPQPRLWILHELLNLRASRFNDKGQRGGWPWSFGLGDFYFVTVGFSVSSLPNGMRTVLPLVIFSRSSKLTVSKAASSSSLRATRNLSVAARTLGSYGSCMGQFRMPPN
jgi:hypothetical protein